MREVGLWILGLFMALFLLLLFTRIGCVIFFEETARVQIRFGFLRFSIHMGAEKKSKKAKKSAKKPKEEKVERALKNLGDKLPKITFPEIKDAIAALTPVGMRALRRTRRSVRVKPLHLCVTLADSDPSRLAQVYGYANALLWSLMPQLERLLVIPAPYIHLGMDFEREKTELRGTVGISARVGTLLAIGCSVGFAGLKWFFKFRKQHPKPKLENTIHPAA